MLDPVPLIIRVSLEPAETAPVKMDPANQQGSEYNNLISQVDIHLLVPFQYFFLNHDWKCG